MSKRVNFADLFDLQVGGRPEPEKVDAHTEDNQTPTSGRPQPVLVDAHAENVDAKTPTSSASVDAKTPTLRKGGRPHKKRADAHKSDRHRADLVRQHFRLDPSIDEKFRLFRAKHNLELQEFFEMAGVHYLECVDAHKEGSVDALASLDDRDKMILFKTNPLIINLYLQYNPENRWKPADDYVGQRYNDKDIRLVEVGIIQTQFNARFKKINSFKYYTTEIDIALETPLADETITVMLKHGQRRWKEATGADSKP
jgi:hypothetical protein